ncbi:MAG: PEGA domain-containing protein [Candidatus Magasanikbacteria bacterium]|nr:PEGA domain-containing protein [Candidatus Magasanikbacteria bacterium]
MSPNKNRLNRPIRLAIMISLIFLFFIISPIVILYTTGYRYDFNNREIYKTGVISIDAEPEDAKVYLNDVQINKSMPIRLTNRAPGTYKLKIQKEGYKDWEKDITVESTKTTYIRDITLFKDALPVNILENITGNIKDVYSSYDGKYILLIIEEEGLHEIKIYNTETEEINTIARRNDDDEIDISWSPYSNYVLIKTIKNNTTQIQILNVEDLHSANNITTENFQNVDYQWQENTLAPSLFINDNGIIYRMTANFINEFAKVTSTDIWYFDNNNELWVYKNNPSSLQNTGRDNLYYSVPKNINKIVDINDSRAILASENQVYVLNLNDDNENNITKIDSKEMFFNNNTKEWICWSDFEIWSIYENGNIKLLNRTGDKNKFIRPMDEYGVLVVATENSIYGFNPGYYITHQLFYGEQIDKIAVNKKTRYIYFLGKVGQKKGLFKLEY